MSTLIKGATVVTLDSERRVLPGTDVVLRNGRIVAVGGAHEGADEVVDGSGQILIPGLVQAHVHLCQTLFRNQADGLQLLDWLQDRIWPLEAAHDRHSIAASARLGIAELIRGGTTAILDMGTVRHTDVIFEAARETGLRLTCGKAHMDAGEGVPPSLLEKTRASLDEGRDLCKEWHRAEHGRLRYAFAPRFVLSCSDDLLSEVSVLARSLGARLHTHANENVAEGNAVRERFGAGNLEVLAQFGIVGKDVALAHCVWVSPDDTRLLAESKTHVVHCPSSNLKLASGIAPIPSLLQAGVSVALGADGAPCNNNLDAFQEMRLAALLHNPRFGPRAMPARTVLELATLGGARALGLEEEIGSIEVGKRADVVLLDLSRAHATPLGDDVYGAIVHSGRASDVRSVWIDGRPVLRDGAFVDLDEAEVVAGAREHAARIGRRVL